MRRFAVAGLVAVVLACTVYGVRVEELPRTAGAQVRSPVKAHLKDGSTVLFRRGVLVTARQLQGAGVRYGLALGDSVSVETVPLDSVVGMEAFRDDVDWVPTIMLTTVTIAAVALASAAAAVAIFGSCPTVYADSAGLAVLQAEAFSYSIAPIFEMRDVDGVRVHADPSGLVRLEIRNEALETHFLNHLELLTIDHAAGETILPDPRGQPLAVASLAPPLRAVDGTGRDVRPVLGGADGRAFASDSGLLARADTAGMRDFIDIDVAAPGTVDSIALVLRLRNSLLATVLLYDVMLGDRGPYALDYVGRSLDEIGHAMELGRFAREELGLLVSVWDAGEFRPVARVGDTGPVAWKDVAIALPVPGDGPVRVRLSFTVDHWRIDRVATGTFRHPLVRAVPVDAVVTARTADDTAARRALRAPDQYYLETVPGQRYVAEFAAGPAGPSPTRTFLLAWQGYYTEWIRPSWMVRGRDSLPYRPGRATLADAVARWRSAQDSLERRFYATRIPVGP